MRQILGIVSSLVLIAGLYSPITAQKVTTTPCSVTFADRTGDGSQVTGSVRMRTARAVLRA